MAKKPVFKTDFGGPAHATDPEALFRDLRGRSPEIKHLWSHQADLLRAYHQQFLNARDVAIELPTGAGKTLVGLLIAEFRRQVLHERIAYVCPTRQLTRQVGTQAQKYGISAHVLIGKQRDYPPAEFSEYQTGKAVAITTYSGIFNSHPRICDAQALVLDDAHASENYIASMWSVEVSRADNETLYRAIADLFRNGLPPAFYADITGQVDTGGPGTNLIELVPGKELRSHANAFRDLLDTNLEEETSSWYAWDLIKEHMEACNLFISSDSLLLRPFIPPTLTHSAVSQANQRVYMSATLGAGGELERITGVQSIQRIPVPAGWDKRGSGRRLFLVPQVAMSDQAALSLVMETVKEFDRSLVLVPRQREAARFTSDLQNVGLRVLRAVDIEDTIDPFSTSTNVTLVLSRYDGLDLPDDTCRLMVIGGLPSGTNLQERFLWSRIAAFSVLRDRVLTRFTQGVGRCTRSDNDYAVVFVWGRSLVDFMLKGENRRILNPELQAELEFGIENCKDKVAGEFKVLWEAFMEQSAEWKAAEEAIVNLRERSARQADPIAERLRTVVDEEVSYLGSMWSGDFESALESARKIADALGGDETKGYRGWWYYLVADAAMTLHEVGGSGDLHKAAEDNLRRATACCPAISWFARLARSTVRAGSGPQEVDEVTAIAVENIRDKLTEWGAVGKRFEREVGQALEDIQSTEHRAFHRGLKALGEVLGFQSHLPESTGAPDCVWSIGSNMYIVHEAKSDQSPGDAIGINDVRQAQSHEDWIRGNRPCDTDTQIVCLIQSPREMVASEAVAYAKSLHHATPQEMKALLEQSAAILRRVRSSASNLSDEKVLEHLQQEIKAAKLTPRDVANRLTSRAISTMTTAGAASEKKRGRK